VGQTRLPTWVLEVIDGAMRLQAAFPWRITIDRVDPDPLQRYQTLEEVRRAALQGVRIDVNLATVDDWLRLPGISIRQARQLTKLVDQGVQFYSIEDLSAAIGISMQRLVPLDPVLQFCYYAPDSLERIDRVNPNTASIERLTELPGVGPVLARAIVRDRTSRGDFQDVMELQERLSLPPELTGRLMHYVRF
jgi:DNA uptake protein ComE-like DNA-binding protein